MLGYPELKEAINHVFLLGDPTARRIAEALEMNAKSRLFAVYQEKYCGSFDDAIVYVDKAYKALRKIDRD